MSYLNVIKLEDAKEYLRISHTDSDNEVRRLIKSALQMIEEKTNVLLFKRDKTYRLRNQQVTIHDGPINTVDTTGLATTVLRYDFTGYSVFTDSNSDNKTVVLSVGHESPDEVPQSLLECAFEMIDYWYYKNEKRTGSLLPDSAREVLNTYTRFII